jgi:hypothetical protein
MNDIKEFFDEYDNSEFNKSLSQVDNNINFD